MKLIHIVGARPQFVKLAPFCGLFKDKDIDSLIIHTGQHYDYQMNKVFFDQLNIPSPDYNLEVGSGTHGKQTGLMISRIEEALLKEKPDLVILYGDTNSTLAGALAASKLHIPVAHIEAGLRSFNKNMPEEINRVLTDHVSDILFCPTENACLNLKKEGFNPIYYHGKLAQKFLLSNLPFDKPLVINVGDVMYDSLLNAVKLAKEQSHIIEELQLSDENKDIYSYGVCTIHRQENTDNIDNLKSILLALCKIADRGIKLIFPVHPRTKKLIETLDIDLSPLFLIDPISYFDMLMLESLAKIIITDSGGMQKEAFLLNVPCLTIRDETEWVETIKMNMNMLVKPIVSNIMIGYDITIKRSSYTASNPYGEGKSAGLIAKVLEIYFDFLKNK